MTASEVADEQAGASLVPAISMGEGAPPAEMLGEDSSSQGGEPAVPMNNGGIGQNQQLAGQEAQNQQMLQQLAQREGQAAAQLSSAAAAAPGQMAAAVQQMASQEAQNQQMLQQMAQAEGQAAAQLGGAQATSATGTPAVQVPNIMQGQQQ